MLFSPHHLAVEFAMEELHEELLRQKPLHPEEDRSQNEQHGQQTEAALPGLSSFLPSNAVFLYYCLGYLEGMCLLHFFCGPSVCNLIVIIILSILSFPFGP